MLADLVPVESILLRLNNKSLEVFLRELQAKRGWLRQDQSLPLVDQFPPHDAVCLYVAEFGLVLLQQRLTGLFVLLVVLEIPY